MSTPKRRALLLAMLAAALLMPAFPASARVRSVVRVSAPNRFPIGDCRPDDAVVTDAAFPHAPGLDGAPTVAVDPSNPRRIVVAYITDAYGVVAASSFDGGTTWRRSVVPGVTKCTGGTLNHPAWPRLAFGSDGRLYLAVTAITASFPTPGAFVSTVGVATSSDGGRTWSPPVWIPGAPVAARSHMIATEPDVDGAAVLTWHAPQPAAVSYLSRTTDGGKTWVTHVLPNRPGQFQPFLTPLATRDGRLHAFFSNQPAPTVVEQINTEQGLGLDLHSPLFVVHSADKGRTWTQPTAVVASTLPDWASAMEDDAGSIFVSMWRDTDARRRELFVVRSDDGGVTWTTPTLVARGVTAPVPTLALDRRGVLGVTYATAVGDEQAMVFARSTDQGLTWTHERVAGPFPVPVEGELVDQETTGRGLGFASAFVDAGPGTDGPTDIAVALLD